MSALLAELRFVLARLFGRVPPVRDEVERMLAEAEARERAVLWAEQVRAMSMWQYRIAVETAQLQARAVLRQHRARLRAQVYERERQQAEYAESLLQFHGVSPETLAALDRCGARSQA